jgi:Zn-dependent protease
MDTQLIVQRIAAYALPLLLALTVREIVRGQVAYRLGDLTAFQAGRLSLNPLDHVDPIGTVALPLFLLVLSAGTGIGLVLGWPKAMPINYARLRNPRRDTALIALSGLSANLLMAIAWAVLLRVSLGMDTSEGLWAGIKAMTVAGIVVNVSFLLLNLLPLLPFDMGQLLAARMPPQKAELLFKLQPYTFVIIILLAVTRILTLPLIALLLLVLSIVGLPIEALAS